MRDRETIIHTERSRGSRARSGLEILRMKSKRDKPLSFEDDRTLSVGGAKDLGRGILLHCFEMLFNEEGVFENLVQHRPGLL